MAGPYYINKLTGNDSWDGLSPTFVAGLNGPWKTLKNPSDKAGSFTVNVAANSGPYLTSDCMYLNQGYIYLNNQVGETINFNFNNNIVQIDYNVNDGSYQWNQSAAAGKTDWYYLSLIGGGATTIPEVKSCVVNGYWSATTTNLSSGFTLYNHYFTNNWTWGDYDTLGFNTLYVKYNNGQDPTGGNSIYVPLKDSVIYIDAGVNSNYVFNNGFFRGGNVRVAIGGKNIIFNKCIFYNADQSGWQSNTNTLTCEANYCKFINSGHRGLHINTANVTMLNAYNNYFENVHLAILMQQNAVYTVTAKNNSSKNLLAGFIQHDTANPTLVESNNQIHLDTDSTHAGQAIAFTAGVSKWAITDATDLPPATATTATTGVDPSTFSNGTQVFTSGVKVGKPLAGSPLLNAGTDLSLAGDFDSVTPGATPNIGAYEGFVSGGGGLSPGLGLSGGNRPPWWHRRRR